MSKKKKLKELIEEALWLRGGLREADMCTSRMFKKIDSYETLSIYWGDQIMRLEAIVQALLAIKNEAESE